jgi:uncharacterized membrane protein YtjA (UPF0391 family)
MIFFKYPITWFIALLFSGLIGFLKVTTIILVCKILFPVFLILFVLCIKNSKKHDGILEDEENNVFIKFSGAAEVPKDITTADISDVLLDTIEDLGGEGIVSVSYTENKP